MKRFFVFFFTGITAGFIAAYIILVYHTTLVLFIFHTFFPSEYNQRAFGVLALHIPWNATEKIDIATKNDLIQKRADLTTIVWGSDAYPGTSLPSKIEKNIIDERFDHFANIQSIDRLTVSMPYGLTSIVYYLHNENPNNILMLHHLGHREEITAESHVTEFFLDNGFDVLLFAMPLLGDNRSATVALEDGSTIELKTHDDFERLRTPLRYFVEPVTIALNHASRDHPYTTVAMTGLSGGGWTTTLMAALDTRIQKSYSVAGTLPLSLRIAMKITPDYGDFEQWYPELYQRINYLELYVLGAAGEGRSQMQIHNRYDSCCFGGLRASRYGEYVSDNTRRLGGEFSVLIDESVHEHTISPTALNTIIRNIEKNKT